MMSLKTMTNLETLLIDIEVQNVKLCGIYLVAFAAIVGLDLTHVIGMLITSIQWLWVVGLL